MHVVTYSSPVLGTTLALGLARRSGRCYVPAMTGASDARSGADLGPDTDDVDLVRALGRGDQAALGFLYDRYSGLLLALGTRVLGNQREAEDLLHDVLLEAWRSAKTYDRQRGTVRAWLCMRMRSRALDRLRSAGRSRVVLDEQGGAMDGVSEEDPSVAPDRRTVRAALAALPSDQRTVLELGYFQGMTSSEIAKHVDIPIGTVKSRVARGLAQLRSALIDDEGGVA